MDREIIDGLDSGTTIGEVSHAPIDSPIPMMPGIAESEEAPIDGELLNDKIRVDIEEKLADLRGAKPTRVKIIAKITATSDTYS